MESNSSGLNHGLDRLTGITRVYYAEVCLQTRQSYMEDNQKRPLVFILPKAILLKISEIVRKVIRVDFSGGFI